MEIVALKNFVQDDVNKIIFKFVGVKPRPLTIELKTLVGYFENWPGDEGDTFTKYVFDEIMHCCSCKCLLKGSRLKAHQGMCEECEHKFMRGIMEANQISEGES